MKKNYIYILFISVFIALVNTGCKSSYTTKVTARGDQWYFNDQIINMGSPAEGLLMNVRMVNSVFEDRSTQLSIITPNFNSKTNSNDFISMIPEYLSNGVNAFTISLQGGSPGYEGAINTAFNADGSLRKKYLDRVEKVIRACDARNAVVILSCFHQSQHSHSSSLKGKEEIKKALVNVVNWIRERKFTNVLLEITNEYNNGGFKNWPDGEWFSSEQGQNELIMMAKRLYPSLMVSTSGMGDGTFSPLLTKELDFFIIHFNNTDIEDIPIKIEELKKYGKPIICNEDDKLKNKGAIAMALSVLHGCGWGYMNYPINQKAPFHFKGKADDTVVYEMFKNITSPGFQIDLHSMKTPPNRIISPNDSDILKTYYPLSDLKGGWRTLKRANEINEKTGIDIQKLDEAFEYIKGSTKNGGLLVLRDGWLVYERYFGLGHRNATPNLASCGKSFTSAAIGILIEQHPELFPEKLDQKIFNPNYLPNDFFPLSDSRMENIKLGQLLSFSSGIRGNNPVYVNNQPQTINPAGLDGWRAMVDEYVLGKENVVDGKISSSTKTLWCEPGEGYSYSTASMHIASIMLRHISGMELQEFIERYLAKELDWGYWNYAYKNQTLIKHTPGGGGIALIATDMLRFGYLMLNEGKWNGKQVIPQWYVNHCSQDSPYNIHYPYSLQFEVNSTGHWPDLPLDAYWKSGSGNHCIYIVPSLNLVVWKLGGRDDQYAKENTGATIDPEILTTDVRNDWKATVNEEEAIIKTLKMVIDGIKVN